MPVLRGNGLDISCPHCRSWLDVEWPETDHDDPLPGTDEVTCPSCDGKFELATNIKVVYTAVK